MKKAVDRANLLQNEIACLNENVEFQIKQTEAMKVKCAINDKYIDDLKATIRVLLEYTRE